PGLASVLGRQPVGKKTRALNGPALAIGEIWFEGHLECDRLGGNHVFERATLLAREYGRPDLLVNLVVVGLDGAAPRAGQSSVRHRGDDVGMRHGVGV